MLSLVNSKNLKSKKKLLFIIIYFDESVIVLFILKRPDLKKNQLNKNKITFFFDKNGVNFVFQIQFLGSLTLLYFHFVARFFPNIFTKNTSTHTKYCLFRLNTCLSHIAN